jgi:hypothetical protein
MGFSTLVYNASAPVALLIGLAASLVMVFLLRNQEKNMKEWKKHPTTFPNKLGGGIIGEYVERPWQNELAQIGQVYRKRKHKARKSKDN